MPKRRKNNKNHKISLDLDIIKSDEENHIESIIESVDILRKKLAPAFEISNIMGPYFESIKKANELIINNMGSALKAVSLAEAMRKSVDQSMGSFLETIKPLSMSLPAEQNLVIYSPEKRRNMTEMIDWKEIDKRHAEEDEIRKLQLIKLRKELNLDVALPKFESTLSKLYFMGKEIDIPKNTNQNDLCNNIFKDMAAMRQVWQWDEMLDKWDFLDTEKSSWRKVYGAA